MEGAQLLSSWGSINTVAICRGINTYLLINLILLLATYVYLVVFTYLGILVYHCFTTLQYISQVTRIDLEMPDGQLFLNKPPVYLA